MIGVMFAVIWLWYMKAVSDLIVAIYADYIIWKAQHATTS